MKSFDEIAKECKETMSIEDATKTLWGEVLSLEKIVVAVYKPTNEAEEKFPRLCIGQYDNSPSIFAFTDKEHYKFYEKLIVTEDMEFSIEYREIIMEEFLNLSEGLSKRGIPYIIMNYGYEEVFHAHTKNIVPMYRRYIKGVLLEKIEFKEKTTATIFVPDEINEMKNVIFTVKDRYKNIINYVSPIFIRLEKEIYLTLVFNFKSELSPEVKEKAMYNLHNELFKKSPLFPTVMRFTETTDIIPSDILPIVKVTF